MLASPGFTEFQFFHSHTFLTNTLLTYASVLDACLLVAAMKTFGLVILVTLEVEIQGLISFNSIIILLPSFNSFLENLANTLKNGKDRH